jgi:hypothetical protein
MQRSLFVLVALGALSCNRKTADTAATIVGGPDTSLFATGAILADVTTEPCTLSDRTRTTCYVFNIAGKPPNHDIGPFCPRTISDPADKVGLWIENQQTYDITGHWVTQLATFYNDPAWQLYDESTGQVRVTDSKVACEAAARPDVADEYNNYCVECSLDYFDSPPVVTVRIPTTPIKLTTSTPVDFRGKVGVSLSGVVYDPPAPTHAILAAHTIAAFDDCGGHVNPHVGYHYHAATGCSAEHAQTDGHSPLIGYATDGFGMYARTTDGNEAPTDLDACGGHEDTVRGYHYHVGSPGENAILSCHFGATGTISNGG